MNYDHLYHAGNFADVFKHVILTALITSFKRKETAFCFLDTHAGRAYYDLSSIAHKSSEHSDGILKVINHNNPPDAIKLYLHCVHLLNKELSGKDYQFYPGSTFFATLLKRDIDRIIACELHAKTHALLKTTLQDTPNVAIHHADGYNALKAFLPPAERRGLILIDPPYENRDETKQVMDALLKSLRHFQQGVYAIWYPIKDAHHNELLYKRLKILKHPLLFIDMTIYPNLPQHLNGCGMVIINPPFQFENTINTLLPWLWNALTINHQGSYSTKYINSALK